MGSTRAIVFTVSNDLVTDQRMIRIATSFAQQGWEVTLVGREKPDSLPLKEHPFKQVRLKLSFHHGPLFYLSLNWALWRYLRQLSDEVVIVNVDLDTLATGWLLRRHTPERWFYEAHEYFPEVPELQERRWKKFIWLKLEKIFLSRLKFLSTVSESVAHHFRKLYPHLDCMVARNFPVQRFHIPTSFCVPKIILYQGDLNEGRGLEIAIEVMPYFEDVYLYIVGDGYLKEKLQRLIGNSKASERIKLLGKVYPDELKAITDQAWIGINLLENKGLNYYYSLANKFGDYLQAGLPQINMNYPEYKALNSPQVSELIDHYSKEDLIKAINKLLNESHHKKLVDNAIKLRARYNWEIEAGRMIKWYDDRVK